MGESPGPVTLPMVPPRTVTLIRINPILPVALVVFCVAFPALCRLAGLPWTLALPVGLAVALPLTYVMWRVRRGQLYRYFADTTLTLGASGMRVSSRQGWIELPWSAVELVEKSGISTLTGRGVRHRRPTEELPRRSFAFALQLGDVEPGRHVESVVVIRPGSFDPAWPDGVVAAHLRHHRPDIDPCDPAQTS